MRDLDGTYEYHLDENRTTTAAIFRADHRIASSTLSSEPNATGALIASDRALALQALADAEHTRTVLDDRNLSSDRTAVDEHLADSRRAIDQARRVQERSPRPVAAIEHYRTAWTAAQRALDVMDEDVEPQISLTTEFDFPHDEPVNRTVNGTVFDVRPYELDGTLSVDDETQQLDLANTTTPATTLEFNRTVELGPQSLNQTQNTTQVFTASVTVSDPGHDVADRGYEPDERLDLHQPQTNTEVVGFDSDGLPHGYEETVTGTDPFEPDSNSSETGSNESNDGVVDGLEDFDGDTISTFYEMQSGTDPLTPDTDDDRLLDGFELRLHAFDATNPDTDEDGTPDAEEDLDGDGLTALGEQRNGTSPELVDTDLDDLTDAEEVFEYGTDPVTPDTDGDCLLDGEEIELGTDPLVADTDGDGLVDGNETYTTATTNESLGVAVAVVGQGNAAKSVTVEKNDEPSLNNSAVTGASASELVRVDARTDVESANVTFDYDSSKVSNESDVSVFRFDREQQTFVELKSTVDAEADIASGTTESYGTFVVLEESAWANQFERPLPSNWNVTEDFSEPNEWACSGENDPTCDTSGEGVTVGGGGDADLSAKAVDTSSTQGFSILCIPSEQYGCIPTTDSDNDGVYDFFDDCPNEAGSGSDGCPTGGYNPPPPSDDPEADDPNEPIDEGQQATNSTFGRSLTFRDAEEIVVEVEVAGEATGDRSRAMFILVDEDTRVTRFFTVEGKGEDGTRSDSQTVRRDLSQYAGETVAFRLVALNDSRATLRSMRISYDSDGDGLADSVEEAGIRTGFQGTVKTDPYSADTDGDGLTDGEEVGARTLYDYGQYFELESNPTKADSDGDGIDDDEETLGESKVVATTSKEDSLGLLQADASDQGDFLKQYSSESDPLYADTDFDGFDDLEERLSSTDPDERDTDGDGIYDASERQLGGDPTLHDFRPPEVSVRYASFRKPAFSSKTHYRIIYTVEDASGVKRTAVVKGDTERYHRSFSTYPTSTTEDAEFTTKFFETSLDSLTGTTVFITAEDRHGNNLEEVGYQRENFYGSVARELDEGDIYSRNVALKLGKLSGFSASMGTSISDSYEGVTGTYEVAKAVFDDPIGFSEGITAVISKLNEAGLLDQLIDAFLEEYQRKQTANNPYEPGTELYEDYRDNWWDGYIAGTILKIAYPADKIAKGLKSSKTTSDLVDRLGSSRIRNAAENVRDPADLGKARLIANGGPYLSEYKYVDGARSAGSLHRIVDLHKRYDVIPDRQLTNTEKKRLTRLLSTNDPEAAKFLDSVSPETRGIVLSLRVNNRADIVDNLIERHSYGRLSTADSEKTLKRLDQLEQNQVKIGDEMVQTLSNQQAKGIRDANFELDIAMKYVDKNEDVVAVGHRKPDSPRTEVDVLIRKPNGETKIVEAKNVDWSRTSAESVKKNLGSKIARYEREYGSNTEIIVEFSDKQNMPGEIQKYITRKRTEGHKIELA